MLSHIKEDLLESEICRRLNEKWSRLDQLRPLNEGQLHKLRQQLQIEMTYNSTAIEGNSLTLRETYLVLREGITIKNKPFKDHLEAKDHVEALDYLDEVINGEAITLSQNLIRQLHQLVMRETDKTWAGKYRTGAVVITGAAHTPPDAQAIPHAMDTFLKWYGASESTHHPVELAALAHHQLAHIHPFFDGNGRTARLLMNLILLRQKYPFAIILKNDRQRYYRVLQQADRNQPRALVRFVAQAVERSLNLYLRTFAADIKAEPLLTLTEAAKQSPYSAKYLNLLARSGKLDAVKQGRNWHTTLAAIARYRDDRRRKR